MIRTKVSVFYTLLASLLFLSACNLYPDDDARVDEYDAVITYYDRTIDFGTFKTYAIVDSVRQISFSQDGPDDREPVRNSQYIIDLINSNMQARNYDKVENPADADLIINAGALTVSNMVISGGGYPGYWWGYPGGWYGAGYWWGYPGYGYYYPWYPITYVTEYEVGTLLIELIDQKNFNPDVSDQFTVRWNAAVRGVVGITDNADIRNRLRIDINQAFEQSPYLKSDL